MIKVLVGQYLSEFCAFFDLVFEGFVLTFICFAGVQSKRLESHPVQPVDQDQDQFHRATDAVVVADVDRPKAGVASHLLLAVQGLTAGHRLPDVVRNAKFIYR